jgi:hypothetical protein
MPHRNMKALPRVEVFAKEVLKVPLDLPAFRNVSVKGEVQDGEKDQL